MKFSLATLYVKDMEKTLHFYNTLLEIPIVRRQPFVDGQELVFLGEAGTVNLELIPAEADAQYAGFSLGFEVESLAAAKQRLTENGYPPQEEMLVEQATLCFFTGPNGERVELIEYR